MTEYYRHNIMDEDGKHRPVTVPISMAETLTLRDQFAMAALIGLMTSEPDANLNIKAKHCYMAADAMIEARKEKK
jgi:hypothetical protein